MADPDRATLEYAVGQWPDLPKEAVTRVLALLDDRDSWRRVAERLEREKVALISENKMLCALGDYSGHMDDCSGLSGAPDCTCGYDDLFTQVRESRRARETAPASDENCNDGETT